MFGFNPYLLGGVAIAFAGTLAFAGCEHSNAAAARADRDVFEARASAAADANIGKDQVISDLRASNANWKKLATPSEEMDAAAARAGELEAELKRTRAALDAKAREIDHAKPDCLALLQTDFERVCPSIAGRLRKRAEDHQDIFR